MADSKNSKISELTELTDPSNADFIPIVDTANTETKKISYSSLIAALNTDDDSYSKAEIDTLIASGMWLYADQSAFPDASSNHGRIVHSHADGAMYYAHAGAWHKIENEAEAEAARLVIQNDVDQNEADADTAINQVASDLTDYETSNNQAIVDLQADVDQNEADADAAIAAVQADVDQNETDADAAIAAVQADVDQNEADADAAIAAVQADVDQNEADADAAIATNTTAIATKANASLVATINSTVNGHTTDILNNYNMIVDVQTDVDGLSFQAPLTFGTANTNAVKIDNTSAAANGGDIAIFASTGIMPKTFQSLKSDLGVDNKAPKASPSFTGIVTADEIASDNGSDLRLDAPEVVITGNASVGGDFSVGGDQTINTGKLISREIQCEGGTSATALPIKYDSNEHRFRDYDSDPTNLMVIKKIDNKNGARIGINVVDSNTPRCALEIVHGSSENNSGTATTNRETLRVMGGSFFNEWARVGHYTGSDPSHAPVGSIIYRSDTKTFKGNCGPDGWKTFTMS